MFTRRGFLKALLGFTTGIAAITITGCSSIIKILNQDKKVKKPAIDKNSEPQKNALDDIKFLAGEYCQGREAGTVGEARAAHYLTEQMQSLGLEPAGSVGYELAFTIPAFVKEFADKRLVFRQGQKGALRTPCVNLLGKISGEQKKQIILLSAHYDHLGIYKNKIYPGANDNASGVGCVLDIVRRIKAEKINLQSTLVIAFWSAEEMGFLGSKAFVEHPTFALKNIKAVFNVDTVGNGKPGEYDYWADGENSALQALKTAANELQVNVSKAPASKHNSDQINFARLGIPAVTLMSRQWLKDNHSAKDTAEQINYQQIKKAEETILQAIKLIDQSS